MKLAALILVSLLAGCATVQSVVDSLAGDTSTFAVCKAGDVITTGYALSTGRFIEKNPLIAPLVSQGIGPLALISVFIYIIAKQYDNRQVTTALNAVTCPVAAHNVWLLVK